MKNSNNKINDDLLKILTKVEERIILLEDLSRSDLKRTKESSGSIVTQLFLNLNLEIFLLPLLIYLIIYIIYEL